MHGDPARIQECKSRYDRGEVMPLKGCSDAHTVAGVLKMYLASLPEPLLSYRLYDSLLAVAAVPAQSRRILALGSLLEHLDSSSKTTLAAILAFLQRCATATAATNAATGSDGGGLNGGELGMGMGMDAAGAHADAVRTLASLFSPLLLRLRGSGEDGSGGGHLAEDVARADHVVELLIEHHTTILNGGGNAATTTTTRTGLSQSSNGMNIAAGVLNTIAGGGAGAAGGENVTAGATRAMRDLDLDNDKENVRAAADKAAGAVKQHASQLQQQEQQQHVMIAAQQPWQQPNTVVAVNLPSPAAVADVFESMDAMMGTCVGSLMGAGDDLFTAEFDRVGGTGLDILYRTPVHRLAPDELAAEKQSIKRRLRSFDNNVAACARRKATKEDKRHLRPLYLRLAHVKRQIHMLETSGAGQAGVGRHTTGSSVGGAGAGAGAGGAGYYRSSSSSSSASSSSYHGHNGVLSSSGGGLASTGGGGQRHRSGMSVVR